jgi:ATP-dependent RNA helicase RhlE
MPKEIAGLADELLRNPVKVSVAPVATTVDAVKQRVIHVEAAKKRALLVELFKDASMSRTLVFTRTKRGADRVARHLEVAGVQVAAIHGNKSQRQREEALAAFRNGRIRVLVATDIAARGIDVDLVTHVVNFELPEVPEAYVHRIGRTARAGAAGIAISFCDPDERGLLRDIERLTRQSIASEDRRHDAGLSADKTPARARDGRGTAREHGRAGRDEGRGGRQDGRQAHGHHRAQQRNGHGSRPHGDRQPERAAELHRQGRAAGGASSTSDLSSLAGIAFLATPHQQARSGDRPRDGATRDTRKSGRR